MPRLVRATAVLVVRVRLGPSCAPEGRARGTFTPMSLTRLASVAVLVGALSVAAGCGGGADDPDEGALGSTVAPTPTTAAASPTTTAVTPTSAPTTKASSPKATPRADGGDGDADGDKDPSTAGGGVCGHLGSAQVAQVVGLSALRGSAVDGVTGCRFDQGGDHGLSVTVVDKTAGAAGGMDGAKTEATSAVEGTPQDLAGIGSAAFVVTGTTFGGPDVNAAGAVQVGNRIISVFLVQRSGTPESKVRTFEVNLLELVARAAS